MGTFFVVHENYFFRYTSQDSKDFKKGFRGEGFFGLFTPPLRNPHLALLSVFVVCFCCCCFCSCRSVSFSSFSSRLSSWRGRLGRLLLSCVSFVRSKGLLRASLLHSRPFIPFSGQCIPFRAIWGTSKNEMLPCDLCLVHSVGQDVSSRTSQEGPKGLQDGSAMAHVGSEVAPG